MSTTAARTLTYDVFVNEPPPQEGTLPNGEPKRFSPMASTLISGSEDAVLTDPGMTIDQARALGDWVASKGRNLTDIFVTHGHGDHWFAAGLLAERFGARVVASAGTIAQMEGNAAARPLLWDKVYTGIPPTPVTAVPVPDNRFTLEGHELVIVEVGDTDSEDTTVLHVPDLELVVAGDVIYNGVHMYLAQPAMVGGFGPWRAAIDKVESLRPHHIVAGHQNRVGRRPDAVRRARAPRRGSPQDQRRVLALGPRPIRGAYHADGCRACRAPELVQPPFDTGTRRSTRHDPTSEPHHDTQRYCCTCDRRCRARGLRRRGRRRGGQPAAGSERQRDDRARDHWTRPGSRQRPGQDAVPLQGRPRLDQRLHDGLRRELAAAPSEREADGRTWPPAVRRHDDQALGRPAPGALSRPSPVHLRRRPEARGHVRTGHRRVRRRLVRRHRVRCAGLRDRLWQRDDRRLLGGQGCASGASRMTDASDLSDARCSCAAAVVASPRRAASWRTVVASSRARSSSVSASRRASARIVSASSS